MAKDKGVKKAKKESKAVVSKPSKGDFNKKPDKEKSPVISSKEILANRSGKGKDMAVKAAKSRPLPKESSEESSEDSSEDEAPNIKSSTGNVPPAKVTESSDSSSSSEVEKPKVSQTKEKISTSKAVSNSYSSSSTDDEVPAKIAAQAATPRSKDLGRKVTAKPSSSSSDESSDSEDGPAPIVAKPAPKTSTAAPKGAVPASRAAAPAGKASDSSDSTSDSSNSDSDSSDESGGKSTLVASKAIPQKAKMSESNSESSDSDNKEDVEMADAVASTIPNGKRKAENDGSAPVKKAKVTTESGDADAKESKTLFVGQLSWNVDNDWLSSEFADAGDIISARVQMDRQSGRSRGFGYVEFATASAAQLALDKFQGKEVDGRAIKLDLSTPRQPNPAGRAKQFGDVASAPSSTLFVGNISWNTTEDMLWEHFAQHGEVSSVRIPTDRESGKPKGFGYVEYSDIESAKKGYESAGGSEIDGRFIRLDYSQPRDSSGGGGGFGGRGRGGDRGGRGSSRGFGDRGGRGAGRGRGGDRGGRGGRGGRGAPRGGARTGGITSFAGKKTTFD